MYMNWFEHVRDRLFGEVERTSHIHHGSLVRTEAYWARHAQWLRTGEGKMLLHDLRTWLEDHRRGLETPLTVMDNPKASGFRLQRPKGWSSTSLQHLLDHFRTVILRNGYRTQLSDLRIDLEGVHRERYYLKPDIQYDPVHGPLDQRYGNILIEAWGPDRRPWMLHVLLTFYSDRLYGPPLPSGGLFDELLADAGRALS